MFSALEQFIFMEEKINMWHIFFLAKERILSSLLSYCYFFLFLIHIICGQIV